MAHSPSLRRFAAIAVVFGALTLAPATASAAGGTALGWGYNASGQVGNGSVSSGECSCIATPTPVLGVSEATELAAGYEFGLALLAGGRVMAWGYNYDGELGDGSTTLNAVPTLVPGVSDAVAVAAGTATSYALMADGSILAWGNNSFGQLGLGSAEGPESCQTTPCSKTPVKIPGISNAIAISAGEYHSMALLANGTVVGWGDERNGEQGSGVGLTTGCECTPTPTPIPGVSGAVAITAGFYTGGALLADGTARNWGLNREGELGTGAASPKEGCACLGPVSPAGLLGIRQLSAGAGHSLALLQSGSVVGWGLNTSGQVGNGKESEAGPCFCVPSPTPATGPLLDAQAVDAGGYHSVVLISDGTIRAWGYNGEGQVGNGETGNDILSPKPIAGVAGASGILASDYNTYAIIGPSQTLRVEFAGDGAGTVGGGGGILCPPACTQRYPQAQVENLRAEPSAGFAGFSGPCSGTGVCRVKMDGDQTVTATFGRPKGTRITKAKIVQRKKLARFSFSAPGAITGYECMLVSKTKKGKKGAAKSAKRRKPRFSKCSSPRRYRHLKPGRYVFRVRALDILGADANPAKRKFKLRKLKTPRR